MQLAPALFWHHLSFLCANKEGGDTHPLPPQAEKFCISCIWIWLKGNTNSEFFLKNTRAHVNQAVKMCWINFRLAATLCRAVEVLCVALWSVDNAIFCVLNINQEGWNKTLQEKTAYYNLCEMRFCCSRPLWIQVPLPDKHVGDNCESEQPIMKIIINRRATKALKQSKRKNKPKWCKPPTQSVNLQTPLL